MNVDRFYKLLKGICNERVRVNAAFNKNGVEYIWIVDKKYNEITPCICKLQTDFPFVIFDVDKHLSLKYPLGTKTSEVMDKSEKEYS